MFLSKFQRGPWSPVLAILFHLAQMPFPISISSLLGFPLPFPFLLIRTARLLQEQQVQPSSCSIPAGVDEEGWSIGRAAWSQDARVWWLQERSAWVSQGDDFLFCLPSSFSYLLSLYLPFYFIFSPPFCSVSPFSAFLGYSCSRFPVTSVLFAQFIPCQVCREELT